MRCYMWQVTQDRRHVTHVIWHLTRDRLGEVNLLSIFQLPSSYTFSLSIALHCIGLTSSSPWTPSKRPPLTLLQWSGRRRVPLYFEETIDDGKSIKKRRLILHLKTLWWIYWKVRWKPSWKQWIHWKSYWSQGRYQLTEY